MDWSSADPSGIPGDATMALALADCKTQLPFLLFCKLFSLWPFQTRMHICVRLYMHFQLKVALRSGKSPNWIGGLSVKLSICAIGRSSVKISSTESQRFWFSFPHNLTCFYFAPIGILGCIILHLNFPHVFLLRWKTKARLQHVFIIKH